MATEVKVPSLGESVTEASVGEWLKEAGESVDIDEPIVSLETDKVAIEVPSPAAGILEAQLFSVGDTVKVGDVIAQVAMNHSSDPHKKAKENMTSMGQTDDINEHKSNEPITMSPAVRRAVLEHGLDPTSIKGSGKDGRLTKEDVIRAAKTKVIEPGPVLTPSVKATDQETSKGRSTERVTMTRMRQTIAKRLKSAQENAALLTTFNDVDMTAVIDARAKYKDLFEKKHGTKLGFMGFFAKAACLALKDVPSVNAYIDGEDIIFHDFIDISVAVSAPSGLVVPVVKDCQTKSFAEIEKSIAHFGQKAKDGTLTMDDMAGGTFTISNGGVFGSLMSTPIINPPQSAVLGLHRIEERPVALNGEVVIKPMMYIALSYDHRLIDGREAVTALKIIKEAIEDPTRILIDL